MKRVATLLEHIAVKDDDSAELRSLKQKTSLLALRSQFNLSDARLQLMAHFMIHEMHVGLTHAEVAGKRGKSTVRQLPSYVYRSSPKIDGTYYALDLGGTNFRVIRMVVRAGQLLYSAQRAHKIPDEHKLGTHEGLFGFIADAVAEFVKEQQLNQRHTPTAAGERAPLGFTFSFPTVQEAIGRGRLLKWTKGFATTGVVNEDVCALLQTQLDRRAVPVKVEALCNDTVGTLVARLFEDPNTEMGVILGTGSNGCYWERSSRVVKDPAVAAKGEKEVIINMEFGNFDSHYLHVLPVTPYDDAIDAASLNKGSQRFEKMISGMYLGEITRRVLIALGTNGALPKVFADRLGALKPYDFQSKDSGLMSADVQAGLHYTGEILQRYGIECPNERDRFVVREVCRLVAARSAQLAGMAIAATLLKSEKHSDATVAIDGSVFEKTPYYKAILQRSIYAVLGDHAPDCNVRVVLQKEGSGLGAGFIAALADLHNKSQ